MAAITHRELQAIASLVAEALEPKFEEIRTEFQEVRADVASLREETTTNFDAVFQRLERIEQEMLVGHAQMDRSFRRLERQDERIIGYLSERDGVPAESLRVSADE